MHFVSILSMHNNTQNNTNYNQPSPFKEQLSNIGHFINDIIDLEQLQQLRDLIDINILKVIDDRIAILSASESPGSVETDSDTSLLGTSSETSILISDDEDDIDLIIHDIDNNKYDGIFLGNVIVKDKEKKFGKRGRKKHNVSMDFTLNLSDIKQNKNKKFYAKDVKLDNFVLSTNHSLTLEIKLKKYPQISGEYTMIIPQEEKVTVIDNGVFCCCEALYEQQSEYECDSINTDHQQTKHGKNRNTNLPKFSNVSLNIYNK